MRLHIETTQSAVDHSSVGLYGMVIDGNFSKVSPSLSRDSEDVVFDLGDGRSFVGGTINYHTYAGDTWEIDDGALRQFQVDAIFDQYLILEKDGQPVTGESLGPDTVYPRPLPTGDASGLQRHHLFLEGPGLEPTGTFVIVIRGEVLSTDDPGELVFDLGNGFKAISGHIAGGNDEFEIAGSIEYVATGGDPVSLSVDGQSMSWDQAVAHTGGSGTLPGDVNTAECQGDADCPGDKVCKDGKCVAPMAPPEDPVNMNMALIVVAGGLVAGTKLSDRFL